MTNKIKIGVTDITGFQSPKIRKKNLKIHNFQSKYALSKVSLEFKIH